MPPRGEFDDFIKRGSLRYSDGNIQYRLADWLTGRGHSFLGSQCGPALFGCIQWSGIGSYPMLATGHRWPVNPIL